ncbi:MAG: hypothetical protein GX561_10280 [Lentisphaerae bacterium]|jgi:hypothetical protein|nr:hypothetical protein [Lentisphaerota bacterium]
MGFEYETDDFLQRFRLAKKEVHATLKMGIPTINPYLSPVNEYLLWPRGHRAKSIK